MRREFQNEIKKANAVALQVRIKLNRNLLQLKALHALFGDIAIKRIKQNLLFWGRDAAQQQVNSIAQVPPSADVQYDIPKIAAFIENLVDIDMRLARVATIIDCIARRATPLSEAQLSLSDMRALFGYPPDQFRSARMQLGKYAPSSRQFRQLIAQHYPLRHYIQTMIRAGDFNDSSETQAANSLWAKYLTDSNVGLKQLFQDLVQFNESALCYDRTKQLAITESCEQLRNGTIDSDPGMLASAQNLQAIRCELSLIAYATEDSRAKSLLHRFDTLMHSFEQRVMHSLRLYVRIDDSWITIPNDITSKLKRTEGSTMDLVDAVNLRFRDAGLDQADITAFSLGFDLESSRAIDDRKNVEMLFHSASQGDRSALKFQRARVNIAMSLLNVNRIMQFSASYKLAKSRDNPLYVHHTSDIEESLERLRDYNNQLPLACFRGKTPLTREAIGLSHHIGLKVRENHYADHQALGYKLK